MGMITFRLDDNIKYQLLDFCEATGISMSSLFTVYAKKVVKERKIPFNVEIDEIRTPEDEKSFSTILSNQIRDGLRWNQVDFNMYSSLNDDFIKNLMRVGRTNYMGYMLKPDSKNIDCAIETFSDYILKYFTNQFIFSTSDIKRWCSKVYGCNPMSIIPTDYCYNRTNDGINKDGRVSRPKFFEYVERGKFRCLGKNYKYNGHMFTRKKGSNDDIVVGEWRDGILHMLDENKEELE